MTVPFIRPPTRLAPEDPASTGSASPAPAPSRAAGEPSASEAAAALARRRHELAADDAVPVTMRDLGDLERDFSERLAAVASRPPPAAPAPAAVPADPPARGGGLGGLVLLVVAVLAVLVLAGTRKGTP